MQELARGTCSEFGVRVSPFRKRSHNDFGSRWQPHTAFLPCSLALCSLAACCLPMCNLLPAACSAQLVACSLAALQYSVYASLQKLISVIKFFYSIFIQLTQLADCRFASCSFAACNLAAFQLVALQVTSKLNLVKP
jgi:hypothetical protein